METTTQSKQKAPNEKSVFDNVNKKKLLNSVASSLIRATLGTLFLIVAFIAATEGKVFGLTLLSVIFLLGLVVYIRSEAISALLIDPKEIRRLRKTKVLKRFIGKMQGKNLELENRSLEGEALNEKTQQVALLSKQIDIANRILIKIK